MKYLIFSLMLFSLGCSGPTIKNYERRNTNEYYNGIGVVQYFLADLPSWANYSSQGSCHREYPVRYSHLKNMRESFSLNYEEAIQFQLMFNEYSTSRKKEAQAEVIPFKDEEKIFFTILDRVKAGIRSFSKPKYNISNIIWIDSVLNGPKELSKVRKVLNSDRFAKGHPIFLSLCMNRVQLRSYLKEMKLDIAGSKLISYEMFNPYDREGNLVAIPVLYLNDLFSKNDKLYIFTPKDIPSEFRGKFKVRKF
ncbi:hypothetical protein [Halobacteriovorax sp. HLS]|uniref:hypothetical protein n=1 Tax=Halobacteriovorax sp. HLS TaxID=2234000 RepID=UPI000FD78915|nr:hypothetical protein [Halobacteriovorax sp. HLS]